MSSVIEVVDVADIVELGDRSLSSAESLFLDVESSLLDVEPAWCATEWSFPSESATYSSVR
jgi:hypothetical protein